VHRLSVAAIAVAAFLASSGAALAHAFPKTAQPSAGSTLATAPTQAAITFTEALEPRFSSLDVLDQQGHRVDKGDVRAAGADGARLIVDLKPLARGTYKVVWHATSVDTHKTQGSYTFTVER
jgi:copper resistance protein C